MRKRFYSSLLWVAGEGMFSFFRKQNIIVKHALLIPFLNEEKKKKARGFWLDKNNQRQFLDEVAAKLGIKRGNFNSLF